MKTILLFIYLLACALIEESVSFFNRNMEDRAAGEKNCQELSGS
jgi:hypothetical protein